MFVHRNAANLAPLQNANCLSVLQCECNGQQDRAERLNHVLPAGCRPEGAVANPDAAARQPRRDQ
jgi:hypothetical protein